MFSLTQRLLQTVSVDNLDISKDEANVLFSEQCFKSLVTNLAIHYASKTFGQQAVLAEHRFAFHPHHDQVGNLKQSVALSLFELRTNQGEAPHYFFILSCFALVPLGQHNHNNMPQLVSFSQATNYLVAQKLDLFALPVADQQGKDYLSRLPALFHFTKQEVGISVGTSLRVTNQEVDCSNKTTLSIPDAEIETSQETSFVLGRHL